MPDSYTLKLPDGTNFEIPNAPGITFIVGPNGVGKSYALRTLAQEHPRDILFVPPGREELRYNLGLQDKQSSEALSGDMRPLDWLSRSWSKAVRQPALRLIAESFIKRLGLPQTVRVVIGGGNIQFRTRDLAQEYPTHREASGILNLPTLGLAVFDPSYPTVVIDEPEQSLHPQAQHLLLQILRAVSARHPKHFILITHSPVMLDLRTPKDLARIVFVRRQAQGNAQREVFMVEAADASYYQDLLPALNSYKREAFFADNVIVVEGENDRDLLQAVIEMGGYGVSLGRTSVLPAGGSRSQPRLCALLRTIGVRPLVLCDRDVINPCSNYEWRCWTTPGGSFEWKGWVSPSIASRSASGSPMSGLVAPEDPAEYERLASEAEHLRTAMVKALELVRGNEAAAAAVPSLAQTLAELGAQNSKLARLERALARSILDSSDWLGTIFEPAFKEVVDSWHVVRTHASSLDIFILPNGGLEDHYIHGGSRYSDKTEAGRAEVADIYRLYADRPQDVIHDYTHVISPFIHCGVLEKLNKGLPHEAAAAVAGKLCEIYDYVFGAGKPSENLLRLQESERFDELSPGVRIIHNGTIENPAWFEVEVPLLRGYLSNGGTYRFVEGQRPDVFTKLFGAET